MRRGFGFAESLLVSLIALASLATLFAQAQSCYQFIPVDPCVAGRVQRLTAQNQRLVAANFNVKVCPDGVGFCYSTTTDAFGNYAMLMHGAHQGRFWFYAWNDSSNWGSSTQSASSVSVFVYGCDPADGCPTNTVNPVSAPRPTPPGLVAPAANSKIPNNQLVTFQWTPESDPLRQSPNWPIVYDVYEAVNGGSETAIASNVSCCSRQVAAGVVAPTGGSVSWRAVAKMNTKVGAPGDPYYQTSSNKFSFTISPPDDFSIAVLPSSATMYAGTSTPIAISTTIVSGVTQTINLSVSGLPSGVTGFFHPNPIMAGESSTLTLTAVGNAPSATATFDVIGSGAVVTRSATPRPSLTVVANTFSLSVKPSSQSVDPGQSTTYTIASGLVSGLAQTISLSVSGLPSGATGAPNPSAVAAGQNSTLVLSTTSTTAPGTYLFSVLGTGRQALSPRPVL